MREIHRICLYRLPVKRELFLNRMARRGWELTDVSPRGFRYTFRECDSRDYRYKVLLFPDDKKEQNTLIRGEVGLSGGEYIFSYGISEFVRMKKEAAGRFQEFTAEERRREILFSFIITGACLAVMLAGGNYRHLDRLGIWAVPEAAVLGFLAILAIWFFADAVRLLLRTGKS